MYKKQPIAPDEQPRYIFRIADNASIPLDPANIDYQEYLKWLDVGNTPLEADK